MAQTNTERETRDFMSVESFSQLPFIRSAPPAPLTRDKGAGAIRLFGKEFGSSKNNNSTVVDDQSDSSDNYNAQEIEANKEGSDATAETSSRKFECHYCCRNFPTSQALGGHQNAHKRERQQAKRAHLQSTMLHGGLPDPHVYGFMNYSRLGSAPPLPVPYHSWTNAAATNAGGYSASSRIYGGYGSYTSQPQPINGSPLAFWRVPPAQTPAAYRPPPPPLVFASKDEMKPLPSSITSISASQLRFGYESKPNERERGAAAVQLSEGPRINSLVRTENLQKHMYRKVDKKKPQQRRMKTRMHYGT